MPGVYPRLSLPPCTRPPSPSVLQTAIGSFDEPPPVAACGGACGGCAPASAVGCAGPDAGPAAGASSPSSMPSRRWRSRSRASEARRTSCSRCASKAAALPWGVADSAAGASSAAERRSVWASSRACNRTQQRLQPCPKQHAPSRPVAAPAGLRSASPNPGPSPKRAAPAGLRRAPSPRPAPCRRRAGRCA